MGSSPHVATSIAVKVCGRLVRSVRPSGKLIQHTITQLGVLDRDRINALQSLGAKGAPA